MDAADYQAETANTALYSDSIQTFTKHAMLTHLWEALRIQYVTLGLVGEAGEIANKVKKQIRDNPESPFLESFRVDMIDEIGDLMWYVSQLCSELELDLGKIMSTNIDKLQDRKERGMLHGSGDDR